MHNIQIGIIEDIKDPEKIGRVKVRVFGIHDKNKSKVPTENLPWMMCVQSGYSQIDGYGISNRYLQGSMVLCVIFNDYQNGIVIGAINNYRTNNPNSKEGFNDPDGIYPEIINESSVNKLARNEDINNTVVEEKNNNRKTGVETSDGKNWDEPESSYSAEYPNNQVMQTPSGHVVEYDDTEGAERIHTYHKSGSYSEINNVGTKVERIVKDKYEIISGEEFVYIKGHTNITTDGNSNIYVVGDANIKVDGNVNETVGGNVESTVSGSMTATISGNTKFDTPETTITGNLTVNKSIQVDQDLNVDGDTSLSDTVTSNGKDISDTHTHSHGDPITGTPV